VITSSPQSPAAGIRWWLGKLFPGLLLTALALVAGAFWLRWHDDADFDAWRSGRLGALSAERDQVQRRWEAVQAGLQRTLAEISAGEEQIRAADKVVAELKELSSTWDRLVGNREQQIANAEQLARMTKLRAESADRVAALRLESKRMIWERDGLEISRSRLNAELAVIANDRTAAGHYLRLAWRDMKTAIIWALYGAGRLIFFLQSRPRENRN
jgi:hypothetical protein